MVTHWGVGKSNDEWCLGAVNLCQVCLQPVVLQTQKKRISININHLSCHSDILTLRCFVVMPGELAGALRRRQLIKCDPSPPQTVAASFPGHMRYLEHQQLAYVKLHGDATSLMMQLCFIKHGQLACACQICGEI